MPQLNEESISKWLRAAQQHEIEAEKHRMEQGQLWDQTAQTTLFDMEGASR